MCLVHQMLPAARGVPGWSPIQVLTPLDGASLRWSDGNRYACICSPPLGCRQECSRMIRTQFSVETPISIRTLTTALRRSVYTKKKNCGLKKQSKCIPNMVWTSPDLSGHAWVMRTSGGIHLHWNHPEFLSLFFLVGDCSFVVLWTWCETFFLSIGEVSSSWFEQISQPVSHEYLGYGWE